MLTLHQFEKAREFVFRYGRLLDRKRFSFHFEDGNVRDVISILSCYQNADGGFGNGLEPDILCPDSSPICAEEALHVMSDCNQFDSNIIGNLTNWIIKAQKMDGTLDHPVDKIRKYPHGEWWLNPDDKRIFSIAAYLFKAGIELPAFYSRVTSLFKAKFIPFPKMLAVYDYPIFVYLNYGPHREQFSGQKETAENAFREMLKKEAWHCPLFFCYDGWHSSSIDDKTWESEAAAAISLIQDDGGVLIKKYEKLPWWRPVWTLEMLIRLKKQDLLRCRQI
jgi:hypothetical protein